MTATMRQMLHHGRIGFALLVTLVLAACGTSGQTTSTTPRAQATVASEWGLQGDGDQINADMTIAAGSATVTCTYAGAKDLAVDIIDASGATVEHLVSPAGTNCAGQSFDLAENGIYTVRVSADGPWELSVTSAGADGVTEVR